MNLDMLYSWLVTASQVFLVGWMGVLIVACIVTFREGPAPARMANSARTQR